MYGVIVVPTNATTSRSTAGLRSRVGVTRARPTSPQSGSARMADAMYATNTSEIERNTRSTVR